MRAERAPRPPAGDGPALGDGGGPSVDAEARARAGRARAGRWALGGTVAALTLSPALQLATGSETLYPVVLLALAALFWLAGGTSARAAGFVGSVGGTRIAILYPLLVVGGAVVLATVTGAARPSEVPLGTLALQVGTMTVVTTVGTLLTEDGFFRGWLWGTLERSGRDIEEVILWTAAASALWHLPLALIEPTSRLAPGPLAVHLVDLWLLGLCWGLLRLATGSVLVVALSHGVWAGLVYPLFGFGTAAGALGIADPLRLDPERGWAGVALNAAAFLVLRQWWLTTRTAASPAGQGSA